MFLPHLVVARLGEYFPEFFHTLFNLGKGNLEKFWRGVEGTGDEKLHNHPMTLEKGWRDHCIPLFVHGDGVEFQSRDTLLCFSWGSLLGQGNSLENHLLLAAFPKLATSAETWPPIWDFEVEF